MTSEEHSGPIPTAGLLRPRLPDTLPAACARHPAWAQQGRSSHQAPCRKHPCPSLPLAPTQLPMSRLPQPHKHTLLTNVVELPCHFHLIMVMTRGGEPSQDQIQSKLISLAGDGNGTPLLGTHTPWEQQGAPGSGKSAWFPSAGEGFS